MSAIELPQLSNGDHCCLFFSSPEEQIRLTTPYLHAGLGRDERCVFIGDHRTVERMREGLKSEGLEVDREIEKGRLTLSSDRDYLDGGHWSTEKMLGFLQEAYDSAMEEGFTALRAAGDVSWQIGPDQDYRDVVYYETLLDVFFLGKRMVGMCEYPRGKCPAEVLGGILNTHKIAAVDSRLCSNFHYVPPELLLEKNPRARQEKRVEWMTSQLVRVREAEAARQKAMDALVQAHAELTRMEKVRDTFGLFVTPEVVDHVLTLPPASWRKGESKTVTVLFADVRRFTPFAGSNSPDLVVELLNEVFSRIAEPVKKRGGILNKFMGDGVLALFGAPLALEDHPRAAALAALEARDAVEELANERRRHGLPPLRIGIGVNTGEVVAGCLGARDRTEYTVIGHAVNVASRLEGSAGAGQILLGPDTERRLDETFRRRPAGSLSLKGLADPVFAYELLARASA